MEASFTELWWSLRTVEELLLQAVRSKSRETTHTLCEAQVQKFTWTWSGPLANVSPVEQHRSSSAEHIASPVSHFLQKEPFCQNEMLFHHTRVHQCWWYPVFFQRTAPYVFAETLALILRRSRLPGRRALSLSVMLCGKWQYSHLSWCHSLPVATLLPQPSCAKYVYVYIWVPS